MPDIRPNNHETDLIAKDVKVKSLPSESVSLTTPLFSVTQPTSKPRFEEYSQDTQSMAYTTLSSGEQVAKFENYLPGTNNEERLAQQQSTTEKWGNGLAKLALKTGTAVVGGTIGVVDSLITGISSGSLNEAYNSGINVWLDDLNTKLDYKLPNYYTEADRNASLFGQMKQANFYADKLFGGLSFMTGAVISEAIWGAATAATFGGASAGMAANTARLSRGLEKWSVGALGGVNNVKKALNVAKATAKTPASAALELVAIEGKAMRGITSAAKKEAVKMYSIGKGLDIIIPIARSAGYESGMEARLYEKQAEESWLKKYKETNGQEPSSEEYAEFKEKLANSANGVFAANMAILSVSNYAQFGDAILGKTTARTLKNNFFNRKAFGLGYEKVVDAEGKSVLKALDATTGQKVFGKVYGLGKGFVTEGIYEEMGQSTVTATANNYLMAGYDKEKTKSSYGLMESFHEGLEKTYGSKEGWTEGLIGGLIGVLGGVGGGVMNMRRGESFYEITNEREQLQKTIDYSNGITADMHLNNVIANNKMQYAQEVKGEAVKRNDLPGEVLANTTSGIARIERDIAIGGLDEGLKDFNRQVNALDPEYLKSELGFETIEEVDDYKEYLIAQHKNLAIQYSENLAYAESLVGNKDFAGSKDLQANILEVQRAIAMNLTMGEKARAIHQDITGTLNDEILNLVKVEGVTDALNTQQILDLAPKEKVQNFQKLSREKTNLEERLKTQQASLTKAGKVVAGEDASVRTNRLLELNAEILKTQEAISLNEEQKQIALNGIGIEQYSETVITAEMIDGQEANVNKFKSFMKDLEKKNPQKYDKIVKLLEQQSKSIKHIKDYEKSIEAITNKTTRLKTINGWVSSLVNRNDKLKEGQKAYFTDVLQNYNNQTIVVKQESDELKQRTAFQQGKEVDPKYIEYLEKTTTELHPIDKQILDKSRDEVSIEIPKEKEVVEKTYLEILKDKVKQLTSDPYFTQYFGESFEEKNRNKPKESDITEYEELLAKYDRKIEPKLSRILERPSDYKYRGDLGLTSEEIDRLKELNSLLGDWQTFQGVSAGNNESVADLLERINILEKEVVALEVNPTVSQEGYKTVVGKSEEEIAKQDSNSRGLSIPKQALRTRMANDTYRWSHITKEKFATFFNEDEIDSLLEDEEGFAIALKNGKVINATYNNRGGFDTTIEEWQAIEEDSNILVKNFGTNASAINQSIGTDSQGNEQFQIVDGDATYLQTTGENLQIDEDEANKIKAGDTLDLAVSTTDKYNSETEEGYHIYVYSNGKLVASLPANYESDTEGGETVDGIGLPLKQLRDNAKKFVDTKIAEGKDGLIQLPYKVEASIVFIGQPNLILQKTETEITTKQNNFTKESIQLVRGQGYMQDGVITASTDVDVKQFISKLSKSEENKGKKIPFIIFDYSGKNVAFPVDLTQTPNPKGQAVLDIINSDTPNNTKIKTLIEALNDNRIDPNSFGIDFSDSENFTDQAANIEKAVAELDKVTDMVDIENFAKKDYNSERLLDDATIAINIDSTPFLTPKVMMKISDKVTDTTVDFKTQKEDLVERQIETLSNLSEIAKVLAADLLNKNNAKIYENFEGIYTDALVSDIDIPKGETNFIQDQAIVKALKKAVSVESTTLSGEKVRKMTIPKLVKDRMGKPMVAELTRELNKLDKIEQDLKALSVEIKNQTLNNQAQNAQKPCGI